MHATLKGPWLETQVEQYLQENAIPLRLACNAADDFPRIVSV